MEAYRERIAQRIRQEAAKHGENPLDLAVALEIHPSTTERWFRAERTPQPRLRKQLAKHWNLPLDEFEPDLEAEGRELRIQLDRIEAIVTKLARALGVDPSESLEDEATRIADEADAMRRAERPASEGGAAATGS
jgi:transcriptional regulator with XRE-family HTH domain